MEKKKKKKKKKTKSIRPKTWVALYNYEAGDDTEVSFVDGGALVGVAASDPGWLVATVPRAGISGMLPGNYVEEQSSA